MEITFDIKHIIDIIYFIYFIFGSVNIPNTGNTPGDCAFGVHAKYFQNFVAANIAAIILSRPVWSDPYLNLVAVTYFCD